MKASTKTVIFMVIITVIFIFALATINEITKQRIAQNMIIEQSKSILYAFNIFPENFNRADMALTSTTSNIPWRKDDVLQQMDSHLELRAVPVNDEQRRLITASYLAIKDSATIYVRKSDTGSLLSFGFHMKGKGLWGTIDAFGVISADLKTMVGIDFIEQVETPGLGARIIEEEYKYFFRNLDLSRFHQGEAGIDPIIIVKQKDATNVEVSTNSLQAITGATQTVDGVLKMVNTDLKFYIDVIKSNYDRF